MGIFYIKKKYKLKKNIYYITKINNMNSKKTYLRNFFSI
jgi:hypothetical protein